ncbi:MAG: AEC family transporter, partial [Clostridia bacterium]|nr:AEC family transporter [Clostridia bacterium]
NLYVTSIGEALRPRLLAYSVVSVLIVWSLSFLLVRRVEPDCRKRGVMIQGMFRSNFVLMGLPLITTLFGEEHVGMASVAIAVVVPTFNVLAVVTLESCRERKTSVWRVLAGIFKNPLLLGSLAGLCALLFNIKLPVMLESAVNSMAAVATPLALFVLGASFQTGAVRQNIKQLTLVLSTKLFLMPVFVIGVGALLGFRGAELGTLMAISASPTAVASYTMAESMGGDGDLAAEIVIFGTLLSCVTLFLWTFGLRTAGLFS